MLLRHVTRKQGRNYYWRAVMYTWISWWIIWRIWRKWRERYAKSPELLQKTLGNKRHKHSPNVVFVDDFDNCVIRNTKRVGIMWRKCQLKRTILVGRVDIVTWMSRYLKEIQDCQDNGHMMFYTHKIWTDSNWIFRKCWQEGEVVGIHTCELEKQAYNAACRGNCWISSSLHIAFTRLDAKLETTMDKWMQQILGSVEPRNLLLTFPLSQ